MDEIEEYDGKTLIYLMKHPGEIETEKLVRLTRLNHLISARTDNPHSPTHRYLYALSVECERREIFLKLPENYTNPHR